MTVGEEIREALLEDGSLEEVEVSATYSAHPSHLETTITATDRKGKPVLITVEEYT